MSASDQTTRGPKATSIVFGVVCALVLVLLVPTVAILLWSVTLPAPLEAPATSAAAPNPSKAPWYFLGLQEMLVYSDPWFAGVVLPTMFLAGLAICIYFIISNRRQHVSPSKLRGFAVVVPMLIFMAIWVGLTVFGTFLRGPNWNFFGPFDQWNPHKVVALENMNLSDMFWVKACNKTTAGMPWYLREWAGIAVVVAYWFVLPPLLAMTLLRSFVSRVGVVPYLLLMIPSLFIAVLPIKMLLRWALNLKYIVYIPEYFFNI